MAGPFHPDVRIWTTLPKPLDGSQIVNINLILPRMDINGDELSIIFRSERGANSVRIDLAAKSRDLILMNDLSRRAHISPPHFANLIASSNRKLPSYRARPMIHPNVFASASRFTWSSVQTPPLAITLRGT